jgi:thiol-disulfide isomerase/thioredoxin
MLLKTKLLFRVSRQVSVILVTLLALPGVHAFDLVDTNGQPHRLKEYKGRWVVVNFWATWCVPCIQEIPEIAQFHRDHGRVVVIGVATDADNVAKVKQFAAKVGHDYPLVLSNDKVAKELGDPKALPTTRIYDPSGKVVYDRVGRVTKKALEDLTGSRSAATALAPSAQRVRSAPTTRSG